MNVCAGIQCTGVHTEECQFTNEGVIHYFEYQSGERFFVRCVSNCFFTCYRVCTFDRFDICRSGHVFDNAVQQFLNTFVSVCGTAHYGHQFTCDTCFTQSSFQFFFRNFFFSEEFFHQFFICFCNCFYHDCSVFSSLISVFCGNIVFFYFCTCCVFIVVSFHFHQVDDTFEISFCTDRQSNCYGVAAQSVYDGFHGTKEVSTHDVHFVNEDHTGYFVVISLSPNCFCLRFYAAFCVQYANSAVQYTQGTFYFNCEVNVTRCIDDVDSVVIPLACCSSGSDCNTSFLFLFHPVHCCITFVCVTDFVITACVEQNTFCQSCFTSVDVRHDTNVSGSFQGVCSVCHAEVLLF